MINNYRFGNLNGTAVNSHLLSINEQQYMRTLSDMILLDIPNYLKEGKKPIDTDKEIVALFDDFSDLTF